MNRFDEQGELALARPPRQPGIPVELVRAKHSAGAAFTLACDASGLDDKEIYLALELDAGTFSRIKKGTNTLGGDMLAAFCRMVGNTLYPEWLAYQVGCGLVMLKTEAERRADALQEELARERLKNEVLMQALRGGAR